MLKLLRNKRAQNTAEYAVLIGLVVAAVVTMQTYVKRGLQGRLKDGGDDFIADLGSHGNWSAITCTTATMLDQYEPGSLSSKATQDVLTDTSITQYKTGGTTDRYIEETTQQAKDDYQTWAYNNTTGATNE